MELADFKTIVSVVENGSITLAAKELNRVPSGITTRIQQMEDALAVSLFLREKNRLHVTPKGRVLYDYARRILELVSEAEIHVKSEEPGGKFRIGAMESMAASRLPEPLAKLYALYPRLEVELTTGISKVLHDGLLDNRLDAIFAVDAHPDDRLERMPAFEEDLVVIAPAGHKPIHEPEDIAGHTALAFKDGCSYRGRLLAWFNAYGMQPRRIAEMTSYHAIMGGASVGMGIGIVPTALIDLFPNKHLLSVHPIKHPYGNAVTELMWRKGMLSANIVALRKCLEDTGR